MRRLWVGSRSRAAESQKTAAPARRLIALQTSGGGGGGGGGQQVRRSTCDSSRPLHPRPTNAALLGGGGLGLSLPRGTNVYYAHVNSDARGVGPAAGGANHPRFRVSVYEKKILGLGKYSMFLAGSPTV